VGSVHLERFDRGSRPRGDRSGGVGKTAVLHEADRLLNQAGVRHATVELDEITAGL
jgi:hypothetical protein